MESIRSLSGEWKLKEKEEKHIDEVNCTCCGEKWTSNVIVQLKERGYYKKLGFWGWTEYFEITYHLVCKRCNISTKWSKWVEKKDFKPKCENKIG